MSVTALSGLFQVTVQKNDQTQSLLESDGSSYAFTGKYGYGNPASPKSNGVPFYDEIGNAVTGAPTTWHSLVASQVGMGINVQSEIEPPMISGVNLPTGAYKTGTFFGGQAALPARLQGNFGYLLYGALGGYKQTAMPGGITPPPSTFAHRFSMRPTGDAATPGGSNFMPFLGFRRYIPGRTTDTDLGEVGFDTMIQSLTIDIPQVGEVTTSINVLGRLPYKVKPDETVWKTEGGDIELQQTNAMSMIGGITLPGFIPFRDANNNDRRVPSIGARITINNNLTSEKEERIVGSYFLDDLTPKRRTVQIEMTYKWEAPEMDRFIFNEGRRYVADSVGTPYQLGDVTSNVIDRMREFNPCLYPTAFRAELQTPCQGQMLVIDIAAVHWQEEGGVQLEGDNVITQRYTGTALLPTYTFESQRTHTSNIAGENAVAPSLTPVGDAGEIEYCSIYIINSETAAFYTGTNGLTEMAHA